jgi:ArsR family transcriptional regulator, arsenate/arsenite/antimonite-responsive transcriptional repressor
VSKSKRSSSIDVLFRALADPTRLRLLNLIAGREICVCYFVEVLRMSQPKISRHLAYLRRAGVVSARREGKWMHYRLAIPSDRPSSSILRETLKHLMNDREMCQDLARLSCACCTPSKTDVPLAAPQPAVIATA